MRYKLTAFIFLFFAIGNACGSEAPRAQLNFNPLKSIPIQHGGRLKPLDTFAREAVQTVTGRSTFQNKAAIELIFAWLFFPRKWFETQMVEIGSLDLKRHLGLAENQKYFSMADIVKIKSLDGTFRTIHEKNKRDEKLSTFEKAVERLSMQLVVVERTRSGEFLTIIPHPDGPQKDWFSLAHLTTAGPIEKVYAELESRSILEELKVVMQGVGRAYETNDAKTFSLTTVKLKQLLSELPRQPGYPYVTTLSSEIFYNQFRPFQKAWILYFISFVLLLLYFITQRNTVFGSAGLIGALLAFLLHGYGFYLRCSITGHPPVGTMYESVVWVSLGVVFFALTLFYFYKNPIILAVASLVAGIGLILSDNLPLVLDPTIRPLAPVLRSNFWLTIHVLTITLSYAAFALAMGLGNWALFKFLSKPWQNTDIKKIVQFIYRSIQIGVLLLAAGTILGGVWADYSWGRFWGWDPKEVWALIALLFYLAIIHGKYAGWLRDFGLAAGAVLAFQGVLMAWYGVNFVLGVGLHSYGFGSGGLVYVLMYVLFEILFILFAWMRYHRFLSLNHK